jgi:predicted Zn-dependent protease
MNLPEGNPRIPEGINASDENPLKEFTILALGVTLGLALLVVILSLSARLLAPLIPFEWEMKVSPNFSGDDLAEPDEAFVNAQAALTLLAENLLAASLEVPVEGDTAATSVPAEAFHFHLMPAQYPNAFASLGGHVMITDALLNEIASENGLAMVVAHEIAHIQLRHPIEAAGRGMVIRLALLGLMGSNGSALFGGAVSSGGALTMLSFDRDMELAADARALQVLRRHYGHAAGADEFFVSMAEDGVADRWLEFAQTHPSTDRRIQRMREVMASDPTPATLKELPPALQSLSKDNADKD